MISIMNSHIQNTMTHWKGKCKHWDVVNEALEEDGSYRRSQSPFYSIIGEALIPIAFRTAAATDPDAKLFYNDYNIELAGSKSSGAQRIVRLIKQYGARIDGRSLTYPVHATNTKSCYRRWSAGPSCCRSSALLHAVSIQPQGLHRPWRRRRLHRA